MDDDNGISKVPLYRTPIFTACVHRHPLRHSMVYVPPVRIAHYVDKLGHLGLVEDLLEGRTDHVTPFEYTLEIGVDRLDNQVRPPEQHDIKRGQFHYLTKA